MTRVALSCEATFTAEHEPPGRPRHANEFRLTVTVVGPLVNGMVMPFEHLQAAVANVVRCIEAVPPTEALPGGSSVEQIAVWIWGELAPGLPLLAEVRLADGSLAVTYPPRGGA